MTSFLGIDAGNTGVKAVLFDEEGRALASAYRETGGTSPAPGRVERDVRRLRRDLDALIAEVLARSGRDGGDVAGVGVSGHGNGLYLLDEVGEPVVAIQSLDARAADLVAEWSRDGTADRAEAIALQRPWPSQTPTLMGWFARHEPNALARARHVLLCKDLVVLALTGAVGSDVTDMGGAGLLRLDAHAYDDALMDAYGLVPHRHLLPPLRWPAETAGVVTPEAASRTGLREGTPVAAGFFDVVAAAVGAGVTRPGEASVVIGTWSINQAVAGRPVPGVFMSCALSPGRFVVMENSATSAANLEWVAQHVLRRPGAFAEADALAAAAHPHAAAPIYHPYLYGAGHDPVARAGFVGVAGWHALPDLLRAVMEGVVFAHVSHLRRLRAAGVETTRIVVSGGGARSPVWPRMLADALGEPLAVSAEAEAGALGAAMAAAVAAGHAPDLDAAAAAMVAPPRPVEPDPALTSLYRERHALWEDVAASLSPHWARLSAMADG